MVRRGISKEDVLNHDLIIAPSQGINGSLFFFMSKTNHINGFDTVKPNKLHHR